jgi:hypothetical protein
MLTGWFRAQNDAVLRVSTGRTEPAGKSVSETILEIFGSAALPAITRSRVCSSREPTPRGDLSSSSAGGTAGGSDTIIKKVIQ